MYTSVQWFVLPPCFSFHFADTSANSRNFHLRIAPENLLRNVHFPKTMEIFATLAMHGHPRPSTSRGPPTFPFWIFANFWGGMFGLEFYRQGGFTYSRKTQYLPSYPRRAFHPNGIWSPPRALPSK